MPLILGIETSCDETAAAVVEDVRQVRSNVVASQNDTHSPYGGVVPELAARTHIERIDTVIFDALASAGVTVADLDAVAATIGPGLAGALLVGVSAAKGICVASGLPLVAVNHLEAHIHANMIDSPGFVPPAVVLLVSGGHTMLVHLRPDGSYELLGQTVDDAVGEAYDKVARFLGLGYPGGPAIDNLAMSGDAEAIRLPRAMRNEGYDFSFSGVKTAVVQAVKRAVAAGRPLAEADVAASFQEAAVDVLLTKTLRAIEGTGVGRVAIAGGVAANSLLRSRLEIECAERGVEAFIPALDLCMDNAAMVASAADARAAAGDFDQLDVGVQPSLGIGAPVGRR